CHIGHVYTEGLLSEKQSEALEKSLWVCIRMLEEQRNMLLTIAGREENLGHPNTASAEKERAAEFNNHIAILKNLLLSIGNSEEKGSD
ncbi:MAG: hypothetical protein H0X62_01235, partial [Bacteroidetes bacterium]|nr:hypothetical protein [Bacteroidota bacterium]